MLLLVFNLIFTAEDVVDLFEEFYAVVKDFLLDGYKELLNTKLYIFKSLDRATAALVFFLA